MPNVTATLHVLIIGGGLGGLALAQALRKQDVTFDIFERDDSGMSRTQGWAVLLNQKTIKDFNSLFPSDLPTIDTVNQLYEHNIPSEGVAYSLSNGRVKEIMRHGTAPGQPMIRANRARLRRYLTTNLPIHWNKRFERYEEDKSGVTAYFEDGSCYRGDILIGADGINSRVRNQMLSDPSCRPQHVPTGVILGELTATPDQYTRWLKYGTSFFVGFSADDDRRLIIAMKGIAADKSSAQYYWMFGWKDENAAKEDFWTTNATKEELHAHVMKRIEGLNKDFVEAISSTKVEGMLHPPLRLRDMEPPELPSGRVSLLGDAIHPMTPFRGQGANVAMADGLSLAKFLSVRGGQPIEDSLKAYEMEERPKWVQTVLESRHGWD